MPQGKEIQLRLFTTGRPLTPAMGKDLSGDYELRLGSKKIDILLPGELRHSSKEKKIALSKIHF